MDSAPRLPAATASITVAGPPPTASPPAKTPGSDVSHVSVSAATAPSPVSATPPMTLVLGQPTDCDDDGIHLDRELAAGDRRRPAAARCIRFTQRRTHTHHRADPGFSDETHRHCQALDLHPFRLSLVQLAGVDGHLGARTTVEDGHTVGSQPQRRTRRVHRRVAAADDGDPAQMHHPCRRPLGSIFGARPHPHVIGKRDFRART